MRRFKTIRRNCGADEGKHITGRCRAPSSRPHSGSRSSFEFRTGWRWPDNGAAEEIPHGGHGGIRRRDNEILCLFERLRGRAGVTYSVARSSFLERDVPDLRHHRHPMNYVNQSPLQVGPILRSAFLFSLLNFPGASFGQDPIIVHYSDPSLTRLENQIGVNAAQKARFEDIIVKYRDPLSSTETDNSGQSTPRSGRHGGGRGSTQNSTDQSGAPPRRGKEKVTRDELDELATILTPAQIKKFQDLNDGAIKKRHSS